ncbi:MAG: phosphoribosylformylglycinamidine synthase subunit PurL [Pseudanabaenaceae cyanobacterium SKYGB_i_bin29]|nr:phosphoribosylformylglycinamidine synthase subunit PurL [Pseudanabaenaceae cyanobacterium SKYG29]MDW8421699.1 phosphoribosylformylglycinamidine synthase subunit PurL [Pseudanabaenaceae cyanobacterium SKYGB_i_bin29]
MSTSPTKREGLTTQEYELVCQKLGREPNQAELGMFGVMWSEHCCYKNSRPLLRQFPTQGERILVGPGENAGVVKISDDIAVCFKIESHNRPSAVEPFQGAATGVGGILRDILTMGARPIAILNSLRFGDPQDAWVKTRIKGVVAGIAHYGNCVGVPTVGGEVYFDPVYNRNPLVNAMAIGILQTGTPVKSAAAGVGNPVLYVGATTGRDGIKGASFASAELSGNSGKDRPAVQVGDPFLEKLLIEACLEAFATGAVVAAQDMGAAGLTCSSAEMAAKGKVGIVLDLDRVPARASNLSAYEYLLSESQERMLMVVAKERVAEVVAIFHRWGLAAEVVGEVIAEPILRVFHKGKIAAEVPPRALAEETPVYHRPLPDTPSYVQTCWRWTESELPPDDRSFSAILLSLLASPSIASKRWIYRQYDHQVLNNTVILPGEADATVIRLRSVVNLDHHTDLGLAATVDGNGRYVYLDPYEGARLAVAEAARNLSCVGAEPLAITDNLNFGSPETPVGYWQLHEACRGIAAACRELGTPVTGGNVSLYNETIDDQGHAHVIYPTPVIGMIGLVADIRQTVRQGWQQPGDVIYLLGRADASLAGSEYLAGRGLITGRPLAVDMQLERQVQSVCRALIKQGIVKSAHDCSEGGLAVALAECCLTGSLGCTIDLSILPLSLSSLSLLFGESPSRIIVSVSPDQEDELINHVQAHLAGHFYRLGTVAEHDRFVVQNLLDVSLPQMQESYYSLQWD